MTAGDEPDRGVVERRREVGSVVVEQDLHDGVLDAVDRATGDVDADQHAFSQRTVNAIERIIDRHRGDRVAIVCHGGVINAYLTQLLGLDADARGFFYPNYTSIHRIAAASSGERTVVTINETSHLRGTGLPMGIFQQG